MNLAHTDNRQPVFSWTLRDTYQTRADPTWMTLSDAQADQVYEQLVAFTHNADDTLSHLYLDFAEHLLEIIGQPDSIPEPNATGTTEHLSHPAGKTVFTCYWYELVELLDEDLQECFDDLNAHAKSALNAYLANPDHPTAHRIAALYREWSHSLYDDHLRTRPPLMSAASR